VRHPKFGAGNVTEVTGHGKEARIRIRFDTAGEKELALSIAPIVKTEDTE
jgi:DNA helicase-2/ATP-dependent DNA helicase PcrA